MFDSDRQKLVMRLIVGGVLCFPASVFLFFFWGLPGRIAGVLLIPAGIALVGIGLAMGWGTAFGDPRKKPVQNVSGVYVISKVIVDDRAQHVFEPSVYDPEDLKFLIQIRFANGKSTEFETSPEVYDEVGEGMNGDIVHQGKWLSQFNFRPKEGHQEIGEDPFKAGKL